MAQDISDRDLEKLKTYGLKYIKLWIETLKNNIDQEEISVTESLPQINHFHDLPGFGKFKQKYFYVDEIKLNLRMTKKCVVEIFTHDTNTY